MNHEPECPRSWVSVTSGKPVFEELPEGVECAFCLVAIRAYWRGREDARKAADAWLVGTRSYLANYATCTDIDHVCKAFRAVVAAARGEGEQE